MKGFIPLPNYFFLNQNVSNLDVLWYPRFKNEAYKVMPDELTEKELQNYQGKPVVMQGSNKIGFVIEDFIEDEEDEDEEIEFLFFHYSKEEQSSSFECIDDISEIRKVEFIDESQTDSTDIYSFLLNNYLVNSVVTSSIIDKNTLTLQIHNYCKTNGDNFIDVSNNYSSVLRLIADPLLDVDDCYESSEAKLANLLNDLLEKSDYDPFYDAMGILPEIANGIIINATCKKLKDTTNPNFDILSNDEILNLIEKNSWETWEMKIEVSDKAWIEHFMDFKPYVFKPVYEGEPLKWEKGKILFTEN